MSILSVVIRYGHDKFEDRAPDDADTETLRLRWIRTLGYRSGQHHMLLKDTDIDEMEEEVELLQEATDVMEDKR